MDTKGKYVLKQRILDPRGYHMQVEYLYNLSEELLSDASISTPFPRQLQIDLSYKKSSTAQNYLGASAYISQSESIREKR